MTSGESLDEVEPRGGDPRAVTAENVDRLLARCRALKARIAELTEERVANKTIRDRLKSELGALRDSYYFSGFGKKLDIRAIPGFGEIAQAVITDGRIGMDVDRLYTLWQAVLMSPPGPPVAEVGSYKGGSSRFIAETLRYLDRSSRMFVCDTFQGHARLDPAIDGVETDDGFKDTSVESVASYLAGYANVQLIVGDIHETATQLAHERSFAFVHIDVDVYPPTDFCLRFFAPRLAEGGVMVVDDYGVVTCPGAQKAVDDFVRQNPAFRRWHLLTGQAIVFRAG